MDYATPDRPRSQLRVLHVIPSMSPQDGGPTFALLALAHALSLANTKVTVLTTERRREIDRGQFFDGEPGVLKIVHLPRTIEAYKVSLALLPWLAANLSDFDLVHVHALFSFSSVVTAFMACRKKIPYIIRPLGVLNRWGMENRRPILKKLSFRLIELPILRRSAAIHYTSESEKTEAEQLDRTLSQQRTVIVPLPINAKIDNVDREPFYRRFPAARNRLLILYLSRLDRKKGLELLLDAFADLSGRLPAATLVIAGDGDPTYVAELKRLAGKIASADRIIWCGFLAGVEKDAALAAANVFVLPSRSENFGIAAAEALAAGVPSIVSRYVGVAADLRAHDAGVVVECDKDEIAQALLRLLTETEEAERLSKNAVKMIRENYSPEVVGSQLRDLYDSILRK